MKIIELPLNLPAKEVEKKLQGYKYLHSYPLKYKTEDGFIEVVRYFVESKRAANEKN